jgi:hypothetical protein
MHKAFEVGLSMPRMMAGTPRLTIILIRLASQE